MTWHSPRTWANGETLTAALLNQELRDNMNETIPAKVSAVGSIGAASAANALSGVASMSILGGVANPYVRTVTVAQTIGKSSIGIAIEAFPLPVLAANGVYFYECSLMVSPSGTVQSALIGILAPIGSVNAAARTDGSIDLTAFNAGSNYVDANTFGIPWLLFDIPSAYMNVRLAGIMTLGNSVTGTITDPLGVYALAGLSTDGVFTILPGSYFAMVKVA